MPATRDKQPATIVEMLKHRAQENGTRHAFGWLTDLQGEEAYITFAELDQQARRIAGYLQSRAEVDDRILLLYPSGLDYIAGFMGCLYAGMVAVPLKPPGSKKRMQPLEKAIADCSPRLALTETRTHARLTRFWGPLADAGLELVAADTLTEADEARRQDVAGSTERLAFLQYTSGSTGNPKGVMVSHGNLMANEESIGKAFATSRDDVCVTWLPFYHDMGLIGTVLHTIYQGFKTLLMAPTTFTRDPMLWLEAITRFEATIAGAPNFGYEYCLRHLDRSRFQNLNLASWRVAFNGAEPVREDTLKRFTETFGQVGFQAESLMPCYGMAESTLFISGCAPGEQPTTRAFQRSLLNKDSDGDTSGTETLVSCGVTQADHQVVIVDPGTLQQQDAGNVGEIWFRGPSVTGGYWNLPEETAHAFGAHIADSNEGPYLRTGDLGLLADGQLYVTGRLKDMIILRGRNFYPQDIEFTATGSHHHLTSGGAAAFSADIDGESSLVILAEVTRAAVRNLDGAALCAAIRGALSEELDIRAHEIVLVKPGAVPKTSSGKVRRFLARSQYLNGTLARVARSRVDQDTTQTRGSAPVTAMEELLASLWSQTLNVSEHYRESNFFEAGGDSLMASRLTASIEAALQVQVPLELLFEYPVLCDLADHLDTIQAGTAARPLPDITAGAHQVAPATFGQQRLWFLDRLEGPNTVYNLPLCLRMKGALNEGALRAALTELLRRHDILRTVFVDRDGEPQQQIQPAAEVPLDVITMASENELLQFLAIENNRPFSLADGPLLRTTLVKLGDGDQALCFDQHHIITDGWSITLLLSELSALYGAFVDGNPSPLPDVQRQYADFAVWQRGNEADLRQGLTFWKKRLAGAPPLSSLPTDYPRPALQTYAGSTVRFHLDAALHTELKAWSTQRGLTPFMTLQTAFAALLYYHNGQEDVLIGTPVANRRGRHARALAGFFVNTIVLRTDLAGDPSFTEVLTRGRRTCLASLAHQETPFEQVVDALQLTRDQSYSPLFQVMFIYHNMPPASIDLPGLDVDRVQLDQTPARFDLTLELEEGANGLRAAFKYNTDLFASPTITRLADHFQTLLKQVIADPEQVLSQISLMGASERDALLIGVNQTQVELGNRPAFHHLFEAQVVATPEAPALAHGAYRLSYQQLNEQANQLGHELRARGVGPEVNVGLCLDRSPQAVIGILGILKAGGSYLPLDPNLPDERIAFLLDDAGASVLVTNAAMMEGRTDPLCDCLFLDRDEAALSRLAVTNPEVELHQENRAYLIYTSGSTGRPKGVAISHRAAINYSIAMKARCNLETGLNYAMVSTFAADLGLTMVFMSLTGGGCLHVLNHDQVTNAEAFAAYMSGQQIDCLKITPSHLEALQSASQPATVLPRRLLVLGGEAARPDWVQAIRETVPDCLVLNHYGPTESTIGVLTYRAEETSGLSAFPLGRPLANIQAYVLNAAMQPVPTGISGELFMGGAGLARGYAGNPGQTAERFLPNPFSTQPGRRIYRSGDKVRFQVNEDGGPGQLMFLGRIDNQIKLRGFRVEPGEIEAVLRRHPAVKDVLVLVHKDPQIGQRLVAYHTGQLGDNVEEARTFLADKLPAYMIPTAWVALDAVPLTPNGKVNHAVLPAPSAPEAAAFLAPQDGTEQTLAAIWAEVLHLEQVSADADFFELGGHSLFATKVLSRIREAFAVDIPLRSLFLSPTVQGLAAVIDQAREHEDTRLPAIVSVPRDGDMALSYAQQRLWFLDKLEAASSSYNMPAAIRLEGVLREDILLAGLQEIVRRHEAMRVTYPEVDGLPRQVFHDHVAVNLNRLDLSHMAPDEQWRDVKELLANEPRKHFDLSTGPMFRTLLIRLSEQDHVLLMTMHHIISDDWSVGLLVRELVTLYEAFAEDRPSPLPELAVQYADFSFWQRRWMEDKFAEQLIYWEDRLADAPAMLELPTDRPRPAAQTYQGAAEQFQLDGSLVTALEKLGHDLDATPFMTLMAVYSAMLYRYSGQKDLLIGTPMAHRNYREIEPLIGFFVNMLTLRIFPEPEDGELNFRGLLRHLRGVALDAYANGDVPFEQVVDKLQPERSLSHSPLFQVVFALRTDHLGHLTMRGIDLTPVAPEYITAKFDLILFMEERDGDMLGTFEYNTDIFNPATIQRLGGYFTNMAQAIVADADMPLSRLPMLTQEERTRILVDWNATQAPFPSDMRLQDMLVNQAAASPEAVAVLTGDDELTYASLLSDACTLGKELRTLGASPNQLVAVVLEKGFDQVIAVYGILFAGAAYLPIDPDWPMDRRHQLLAQGEAAIVLTDSSRAQNDPWPDNVTCVAVDSLRAEGRTPEGVPEPVQTATDLAYVIFTSGSTGKPKGVVIDHRGAVNTLVDMNRRYQVGPEDRILAVSALSFDLSVYDIFGLLAVGGAVVMPDEASRKEPAHWVDLMARRNVTLWDTVPALVGLLVDHVEAFPESSSSLLRLVIMSGDWIPISLPDRIRVAFPNAIPMSHGGATEASIWSIFYPIGEVQTHWRSIPYGYAMDNQSFFVLDRHLEPCPIGVRGDLYIGGVGLALGYWRDEEKTAASFITRPDTGERLYRTGDLGRYLPNQEGGVGPIEFLGRADFQVKVHGYRVELGEIESLMEQHDAIQKAVAVVRQDSRGAKQLTAYLEPADGADIGIDQVRDYLREKLPEYMVPKAYMILDALPLTANGKVNRGNLPEPEIAETGEGHVAPRNSVEQALATIWADLLGVPQVGVNDNFFALGGDSILGLQAIARARTVNIKLVAKQIFEHQTVAELARVAEHIEGAGDEEQARPTEAPLTPVQHWFYQARQPQAHHWNQAVMLAVTSELDGDALTKTATYLTGQHESLALRFDGQKQSVSPDAPADFFVRVDLSAAPAEDDPAFATQLQEEISRVQGSLNLTDGPLWRVAWFDFGAGRSDRLLFVIHHLGVDAVSWRILLEDFQAAYHHFAAGKEPASAARTASYLTYAQRLTRYAEELSDTVRTFWQDQLAGPTKALPLDHVGGENVVASQQKISFSLTEAETTDLLQQVPLAYRTRVDELLLCALGRTLCQWVQAPEIRVDMEGHGRTHLFDDIDLTRTVGWFTTIKPVCLAVGDQAPGDALKRVKQWLAQMPNDGLDYGVLRYLDNTSINTDEPQVLFNYLGQLDTALSKESTWQPAPETIQDSFHASSQRTHLMDISAAVRNNQLVVDWSYSENLHQQGTVQGLVDTFQAQVKELMGHCLLPESGGVTPSDFSLLTLEQQQLDQIFPAATWREVEDIYPLSPLQQGLLFHELYEPGKGVYFNQLSCMLRGELARDIFRDAWQAAVDRHAILRTSFLWQGLEDGLQVVHRHVTCPFEELDWRDLTSEQQTQRLESFTIEDQNRGFQLDMAPLMRVTLIRLDDETYHLFWSHHHLLLDGWCAARLIGEISQNYESLREDKPITLSKPRPYRDFIAWLRRQDMADAEAFWRERLAGFSERTALPTRAEDCTDNGYHERRFLLNEDLTSRLHQLALQHRVTLNTLVQGAWALLLSRYGNTRDVLFGVAVAGRPADLEEMESMLGPFINTLPLRLSIDPNALFTDWIQDIQAVNAAMRQYEHSPLVEVQGWSEIPRGTSLFDSMFVFENYPMAQAANRAMGKLNISNAGSIERTNYPLTLMVLPGDQLSINLSYNQAHLDADTIERIEGHLRTVLGAMADRPETTLSQLPFLTPTEHVRQATTWNTTARGILPETSGPACIHHLFEAGVARDPDVPAVVFEDVSLSRAELNDLANGIANQLRAMGIGLEDGVGLCVSRSHFMVASVLGVLKAGGIYVPLDPDLPAERLTYILEDAAISTIIVRNDTVPEQLPPQCQVLNLDHMPDNVSREPIVLPAWSNHPDRAAYVLYTSGSTGKPKGVAGLHRGALNRTHWMMSRFGFRSGEQACHITSLNFVRAVWELWVPLSAGIPLVVLKGRSVRDVNALLGTLTEHKVSRIVTAPSLMRAILAAGAEIEAAMALLDHWFVSGEALPSELLHGFGDRFPRVQVTNLYGSTEITSDVLFWEQPEHFSGTSSNLPVGKPIDNTSAYLLSGDLRLVPVGVLGEICIAGENLARGYLNRAGQTATSFSPNPFSGKPGDRIYHTGDYGRYQADGNIIFAGRIDHQVKVRGYRIELGEIEVALRQHPDVRLAVAVVRGGEGGDLYLAAYVENKAGTQLSREDLQTFLEGKLPPYMMPSVLSVMDHLPLLANGKVDRQTLQKMQAPTEEARDIVAPRTETEAALVTIVAEILGLEQVGVHDEFFQIGGHSLTVFRVISRIKERYEVDVPLRTFFARPTIAELAKEVDELKLGDDLVWGDDDDDEIPFDDEEFF